MLISFMLYTCALHNAMNPETVMLDNVAIAQICINLIKLIHGKKVLDVSTFT